MLETRARKADWKWLLVRSLSIKNPQRCHLLVLCLISLPFLRPPGVFQYSHAAPVFDQTNLMCVQLLSDAKFQYYKEENKSTLRITPKLSVAKITGFFWRYLGLIGTFQCGFVEKFDNVEWCLQAENQTAAPKTNTRLCEILQHSWITQRIVE